MYVFCVFASLPPSPSNPFPPLFHVIYCKRLGLLRLGVSIHNNNNNNNNVRGQDLLKNYSCYSVQGRRSLPHGFSSVLILLSPCKGNYQTISSSLKLGNLSGWLHVSSLSSISRKLEPSVQQNVKDNMALMSRYWCHWRLSSSCVCVCVCVCVSVCLSIIISLCGWGYFLCMLIWNMGFMGILFYA